MADIFISYAGEDRDQTRLLALFLEAKGYSVWWDVQGLRAGDEYREIIAKELARARCVIVIWTKASVRKDFVQSEARRAQEDRKLIPLKEDGVTYRDIPMPFDNMYVEDIDRLEKIVEAVVAKLAKPHVEPSRFNQALAQAKFQLLSWFGIIGTAITVGANAQGAIKLATWIKAAFESWALILQGVWQHVLFFLPKVLRVDALQLTLLSFVVLNLAISSRKRAPSHDRSTDQLWSRLIAIAPPALIIAGVFMVGLRQQGRGFLLFDVLGGSLEEDGQLPFHGKMQVFLFNLISNYLFHTSVVYSSTVLYYIAAFLLFVILPIVPVAVLYMILARLCGFRLDEGALSSRLWKIVIGLAILIAVNYLVLWIEGQPWARAIMT